MNVAINLLLFVGGFTVLIWGAKIFVDASVLLARKARISELIIGLTVAAMGTSLPELTVSVIAAIKGNSDIAVGNVVGSNILNVLLILGISTVMVPLIIAPATKKYEIPIMIAATLELFILGLDGRISRIDGMVFCLSFFLYLIYLFYQGKTNRDNISMHFTPYKDQRTPFIIAKILVSLALVILGSSMAVRTASAIAKIIGISDQIIGLTIVSIGTSLPELTTSIIAAKNGKNDLAVGNIVGSNIFNIYFILGLAGIITPIGYSASFLIDTAVAIMTGILLWLLIFKDHILGRIDGLIMIGCYLIYLGYLIYYQPLIAFPVL